MLPAFLISDKPCFLFDDGTTQGWTINQLYNTDTQQKITTKYPNGPFELKNYNNIGLEAAIMPSNDLPSLSKANIKKCDIYLESPILLNYPSWQKTQGVKFELINKLYSTLCAQAMGYAQLQVMIVDSTNNERLFVESDPTTNAEIMHPIWNLQTYQISWSFNFQGKINIKYVKQVRIRLTASIPPMNYYMMCGPEGSWVLSGICTI